MWLERLAKQRKGNLQGRDKERGSCCFLSSARGGSVIRRASESRKGFPAPGLRLPSHTQTWNRLGVPAPRQPLPPFRDVRRSPAGPGQPSPSSKVSREDPRPAKLATKERVRPGGDGRALAGEGAPSLPGGRCTNGGLPFLRESASTLNSAGAVCLTPTLLIDI